MKRKKSVTFLSYLPIVDVLEHFIDDEIIGILGKLIFKST